MRELSLNDIADLAAPPPERVLRPRRGLQPIDPARLWRFRDLLWMLALRDIQVRYKQAALGALWAVFQPLVLMVVFRTFLGRYTGRVDPVELFCVLVPWMFFSASVVAASNSLIGNADLLRKVYFPRLIAPLASVGAPLLDFAIAFVVLFGLMAWFGTVFSWQLALLPLLVASTIIAALGVGILMAALTVSYRDFRFVVPFLVQLGLFITPVIYPITMPAGHEHWNRLLNLNPMFGVIECFRAAVLSEPMDWIGWAISTAVGVLLLIVGLQTFSRTERRFADVV